MRSWPTAASVLCRLWVVMDHCREEAHQSSRSCLQACISSSSPCSGPYTPFPMCVSILPCGLNPSPWMSPGKGTTAPAVGMARRHGCGPSWVGCPRKQSHGGGGRGGGLAEVTVGCLGPPGLQPRDAPQDKTVVAPGASEVSGEQSLTLKCAGVHHHPSSAAPLQTTLERESSPIQIMMPRHLFPLGLRDHGPPLLHGC